MGMANPLISQISQSLHYTPFLSAPGYQVSQGVSLSTRRNGGRLIGHALASFFTFWQRPFGGQAAVRRTGIEICGGAASALRSLVLRGLSTLTRHNGARDASAADAGPPPQGFLITRWSYYFIFRYFD